MLEDGIQKKTIIFAVSISKQLCSNYNKTKKMGINKYLHTYKEEYLVETGMDKCISMSRSFPLDDINQLDISIFRFFRDAKTPLRYLVANMCYWYGKTDKGEELTQLLLENSSQIAKMSRPSTALAIKMYKLGKKHPFWNEDDVHFIEKVWRLPKAFIWIDPIMFDSYEIETQHNLEIFRKRIEINAPGEKAIKKETLPYSQKLLKDIISALRLSGEPDFRPFYNRKTDKVSLYLSDDKKSIDDFFVDYWIEYKEMNFFLTETYGERCAYVFAEFYLKKEKEQFSKEQFVDFVANEYGEKCSFIISEAIENGSVIISKIPNKFKSFKKFLKNVGWLDVFAGFSGNIHRFQKSVFAIDPMSVFNICEKVFVDMSLWVERDYIACWLASKYISYCKGWKEGMPKITDETA